MVRMMGKTLPTSAIMRSRSTSEPSATTALNWVLHAARAWVEPHPSQKGRCQQGSHCVACGNHRYRGLLDVDEMNGLTMDTMTAAGAIRTPPSFRVWVLVLLLLFLSLCGIHLLGAHHDGESHALSLAIAAAAVLHFLGWGRTGGQAVLQSIDWHCTASPFFKPRQACPIRAPIRV